MNRPLATALFEEVHVKESKSFEIREAPESIEPKSKWVESFIELVIWGLDIGVER
jgi:hypothetical protein